MEIEKLKKRLQNANKAVFEFSITVIEARNLLTEISILESKIRELENKVEDLSRPAPPMPTVTRIIDGGEF
jgi:predicted RNase H-like nuclease (RuvC/YqgF family)